MNKIIESKKFLNWSVFVCWLLNFLQHLPSFFRSVFTGDERVYLSLSHYMGWDLSNYTTMYDPIISQWPNTIYSSPLFHHGSFFPYVLKIGSLFSSPSIFGFLFSNTVILLFILHVRRLQVRLNVNPIYQLLVYVFIAIAPLILFSTTRLHIDGITGMLLASGLISTIEAFEKKSIKWGIWAGILLAVSLNTGFTGILLIPVLFSFQFFYVFKSKAINVNSRRVFDFELWKVFSVISIIVFSIGMLHYYRLFYIYGTIFPSNFVQNFGNGIFHQYVSSISKTWMFFNILFLIPILFLLFSPETYKVIIFKFKQGDWGALLFSSFLFMFLMILFLKGKEVRRFSNATPLLYCCIGWLLSNYNRKYTPLMFVLTLFSITSMASSSYREIVVRPNEVYKIISPTFQYADLIADLYAKNNQIPVKESPPLRGNIKDSLTSNLKDYNKEDLINLSFNLYQNNKYLECIEVCYMVIDKDPQSFVAYNNICSAYNQMREYKKAITACEKAIKINPDYSIAVNNLNYAKENLDY